METVQCYICGDSFLTKGSNSTKNEIIYICPSCRKKYTLAEISEIYKKSNYKKPDQERNCDDSTSLMDNYFIIAESAFDAGNKHEAEIYCMKILETNPKASKAWFLKGKVSGWQSTTSNIRFKEAINCFINAINNEEITERSDTRTQVKIETQRLGESIIYLVCENFEYEPTYSSYLLIIKTFMSILCECLELRKFGISLDSLFSELSEIINNSSMKTYRKVENEYNKQEYPNDFSWKHFRKIAEYCLLLQELIVKTDELKKDSKTKCYEQMIDIQTGIIGSFSCKYSGGRYIVDNCLDLLDQLKYVNNIMGWHQKIKELNSNYIIPRESFNSIKSGMSVKQARKDFSVTAKPWKNAYSLDNKKDGKGACYIATCVYGSYDCPQVWTLRRYRDLILSQNVLGRIFIHTYYLVSPSLVNWFGSYSWFRIIFKKILDYFVLKLQYKGINSNPYIDKKW